MKIYILALLMTVSANGYGACIGDKNTKEPIYSFYVVPQLAVSETYLAWYPILDQIGKKLSVCFDLQVPKGIPAFEQELKAGKADFAYMNPYHLLVSKRYQGYLPIIADSKNQLAGIIVIKGDSHMSSVRELDGKKMAFPAPNAMAASLLIRAYLARSGIQIHPEYVKTHSNVFRSVVVGDYVAGGGVNNTFIREPDSLQQELKILFETPKYMPHPIAVHPRVPLKIRKQMAQSFVEFGKDPNKAAELDAIQIPRPIEVNYQKDYQYLEKLRLDRFAENIGG